jgi:hypothetical protein
MGKSYLYIHNKFHYGSFLSDQFSTADLHYCPLLYCNQKTSSMANSLNVLVPDKKSKTKNNLVQDRKQMFMNKIFLIRWLDMVF